MAHRVRRVVTVKVGEQLPCRRAAAPAARPARKLPKLEGDRVSNCASGGASVKVGGGVSGPEPRAAGCRGRIDNVVDSENHTLTIVERERDRDSRGESISKSGVGGGGG